MSTIKQLRPEKIVKPEQVSDLAPEERRRVIEGASKKEFFRRLRKVEEWRKARLARIGQDSR